MKLNSVILNFIWDGKKPKIPMKTLYANKEDGGASLIDMELKDRALKANWIQIIHTDKYLSEFAFQALCPIMRETFFQCNIGQKDITIFKKSFWQDVLKCWASFNFCHEVKTVKEILDQIIWYNSPIRIDDKIFLFKDACKSGLMYIAQIFDVTNGTIIDTNILTQMFELTLMQCNAIISAIPQDWNRKVHSLCQQGIDLGTRNQSNAEQIIVNKKSVSFIYKAINQSDKVIIVVYNKWKEVTGLCIEFDQLVTAFRSISKTSIMTKYHSFQYRFLHKAIVLNGKLY